MPKVGLGSKVKRKADDMDFTKIDVKGAVTNVIGRLGKHSKDDLHEESATNTPPVAKGLKLPWKRKAVEKEQEDPAPEIWPREVIGEGVRVEMLAVKPDFVQNLEYVRLTGT